MSRPSPRAVRFLVLSLVAACTRDALTPPSDAPVVVTATVMAKSPSNPSVSSTNPPFGDQGATVDVKVIGSGFTSGAQATWLLHGTADAHVRTNTTTVVSSTELDANITIASDATLAFWDVQVALVGGKNGVGADVFEVTTAQQLSTESTPYVRATNDLLEIAGGNSASPGFVYDDHDGAPALVRLNGQAWGLVPDASIAVGRDASGNAAAWTRQTDGSWTETILPAAPGSTGGTATGAARTANGALLVSGYENLPAPRHSVVNEPVVWQFDGTTWSSPAVYAYPAGATTAGARAVASVGVIVGAVDANGDLNASATGAVWDSPSTPTRFDGLPIGINSAGTLVVGQRNGVPVYWWRDKTSGLWHTTGVALPSIAGTSCPGGQADGLNDAGTVVGYSCNSNGANQATAWRLDFSGATPVLVGSATALSGLGSTGGRNANVSEAVGVSQSNVAGGWALSGGQQYIVRWRLP